MAKKTLIAYLQTGLLGFIFCFSSHGQEVNSLFASSDLFDRAWFDSDILYWKIQDAPKPIDFVKAGSHTIEGGRHIDNGWRFGNKYGIGYWITEAKSLGVEGTYFFLEKRSDTRTVRSDGLPGSPFFTIPFFNVITQSEDNSNLSLPGVFSGLGRLKVANDMQGAELNVIIPCTCACGSSVLLAGFRYWNFNEKMTFKPRFGS